MAAGPPGSRRRAPCSCPVAVGRDVPIAPPRHRRGAWLCLPLPRIPSSRAPRSCPVAVWCRGLPRVRATERRALRDYGGRTETSPRKTLSVCYSPCPRALPGRRDRDIAPYRHYAPPCPRAIFAPLAPPARRAPRHYAPTPPRRPATAKTERMLPIFQDRSAREFTLSVREQFATISIPHFYRLFRRKLAKKTSERSYSRFFSSPCRDFQRRICSPNPPGKQQN